MLSALNASSKASSGSLPSGAHAYPSTKYVGAHVPVPELGRILARHPILDLELLDVLVFRGVIAAVFAAEPEHWGTMPSCRRRKSESVFDGLASNSDSDTHAACLTPHRWSKPAHRPASLSTRYASVVTTAGSFCDSLVIGIKSAESD